MNQKISIKSPTMPKIFADLVHSNQFLKVFSIVAMAISLVVVFALSLIGTKPPVVLTLATNAKVIEQATPPKAEDQIRAAIQEYLERRYKWEPTTVQKQLAATEAFILPQSIKSYRAAVANVAKFSIEKIVSQRVYPSGIEINLEKQTAFVTGDRVTAIQGIKAAGDLKLELSFESGPRTKENPWGVYVVKEREL